MSCLVSGGNIAVDYLVKVNRLLPTTQVSFMTLPYSPDTQEGKFDTQAVTHVGFLNIWNSTMNLISWLNYTKIFAILHYIS